jgi:anti-sigma factor RsiW
MTHIKRIRDEVQAFHDGELPQARRAALAEHLARCSECTAERQRLQECDRLLADAWPEPEAFSPDSARDLLQRALAEAGARRREYRRQRARVAWRLAAAVFLLSMGSLGRIARQTSMPPEVSSRLSALGGKGTRQDVLLPSHRAERREPSAESRSEERATGRSVGTGLRSPSAERRAPSAR